MILLTASLIISLVFTISLTGLYFLNTDWLIQFHFSPFISIPHIPNSDLMAEKLKILCYFPNVITALVFFQIVSTKQTYLPMQDLEDRGNPHNVEAILPPLLFLIASSELYSALLCCCFFAAIIAEVLLWVELCPPRMLKS